MFTALGGTGAVMMHVPCFQCGQDEAARQRALLQFDALRRSLDELMPELERAQVPLALENMWGDDWKLLNALLDAYPPELVGITYDSGHGNSDCLRQLELLDAARERLTALHLHDNDGSSDLHQPPFYGTVDWERLAEILADSPYPRELSFELAMRNTPYFDKGRQEQTPEHLTALMARTTISVPGTSSGLTTSIPQVSVSFHSRFVMTATQALPSMMRQFHPSQSPVISQ